MNAKNTTQTTLIHPRDIASSLSQGLTWLTSFLRFWMLDLAILIVTALLVFTDWKVLHFHLLFILLTFGAFYWTFQAFAARAIFGFVVCTSSLLSFVMLGTVPAEELIEVPLLTSILILVFVIAHQRSDAEKKLRIANDTLESRVIARTQELSASREHYRQLTELSLEAIVIHAEQRLLYINPAGLRLLGAESIEQVQYLPITQFIHPDSIEEIEKLFRFKIYERTTLPAAEGKFMRLDGSAVDVEILTADIVFDARPATLSVLRDITVRKQIERVKQEERNSIARDIHDSIGQSLGFLHLKLDQLAESEPIQKLETTRNELVQMRTVSADAYTQVRQILASLMPNHTMELSRMVRNQVKLIAQRGSFQPQVVERGNSTSLNPFLQQQIFFICSEALTNISKHADAKTAKIDFAWQKNQLSITIQDDGIGFDLTEMPKSFGLQVMKERAAQINSLLLIDSEPNVGTTLQLQIPLSDIAQ